jgi:nucleotide-binding universal stress UspA family protein
MPGDDLRGSAMRKILLATDGSSGADRAGDVAVQHAKATDGKLYILTVGGNMSRHDIEELARAEGSIGDALDAMSARVLERAEGRARSAGVSEVEGRGGWGDPSEVIIETAQRLAVDSIVMGRRGLGRLAGLLLGSVSQKVATHATCVVILVP